jgi:hypothetical protein
MMPNQEPIPDYSAFEGSQCLASGPLADVALQVKSASEARPLARILVFNNATGEPIDFDCRGTPDEMLRRLQATFAGNPTAQAQAQAQAAAPLLDPASAAPAGPGRPRLGVVAREVTLLPRHWEWLGSQTGGASVALRKLVEQARRSSVAAARLEGFEEAARALFAADRPRFNALVATWPVDVRTHLMQLADAAFQTPELQDAPHA